MADAGWIFHNTNTLGNITDEQERIQGIKTISGSSSCTEEHETLLGKVNPSRVSPHGGC